MSSASMETEPKVKELPKKAPNRIEVETKEGRGHKVSVIKDNELDSFVVMSYKQSAIDQAFALQTMLGYPIYFNISSWSITDEVR